MVRTPRRTAARSARPAKGAESAPLPYIPPTDEDVRWLEGAAAREPAVLEAMRREFLGELAACEADVAAHPDDARLAQLLADARRTLAEIEDQLAHARLVQERLAERERWDLREHQ
jgi:hypothetical protein